MCSITLRPDDPAALRELVRSAPDHLTRQRALILLLLSAGVTWAAVTAALGCSSATVARWADRYRAGGVPALTAHVPRPSRLQEACEQLGICERRFEALRTTAIRAGVAALEPRPVGRPPRVISPDHSEITRLRERIAELETQLQAALIRAELAGALPRLQPEPGKPRPRSGRAKESKWSRSRPGNTSKR